MTRRYPIWVFIFVVLVPCAQAQDRKKARAKHVVLVSVDGLRPDAIEKAKATNLLGLIKKGAFCAKAQTIDSSITLPSHTSMVTGLTYDRHGVDWNGYEDKYVSHPTIFSVAKKAGLSTAFFYSKNKMLALVPKATADYKYGPLPPDSDKREPDSSAMGVAKAFAAAWQKKAYALTFIHLREPDSAGHGEGWMSEPYIESIREVDEALGLILKTLKKTKRLSKTVIIISADHGGHGDGHGSDDPRDMTIPWVCMGPGVKAGTKIKRAVQTYDTAPTVLAFLGLKSPKGIDGKVVREVFGK